MATQQVTLAPSSTVSVVFGVFSQSWQWLDQFTGVPTGPTAQSVSYSVAISMSDDQGNVFPEVTSQTMIVNVSVPDWKLGDAFAAQTAFDNFVIDTAAAVGGGIFSFGVLAAVFGGLATAAAISEQEFAQSAEDPPEPSLGFDRVEPLRHREIVAVSDPDTENLRKLLAFGLIVTDAQRVLSVTEGRLAGARQMASQDGVQRQLEHCRMIAATVKKVQGDIMPVGAKANRELHSQVHKLSEFAKEQHRKQSTRDVTAQAFATPQGVNKFLYHLLTKLHEHPAVSVEVWSDTLEALEAASRGIPFKMARRIAAASASLTNRVARLLRTGD